MTHDLDAFAARLSAAWQDDASPEPGLVEQWLGRFLLEVPPREPDTCADGLSSLAHGDWQIRWYDIDDRVLGFWGDRKGYSIPWREIDAFTRRLETCDDNETPPWRRQLPLAG